MDKPIYQLISQLTRTGIMSTKYVRSFLHIILVASLLHSLISYNWNSLEILHNLVHIFGASLSEPHTSGTALGKCVCNVLVCLRPYTINFKCI